MHDVVADGAAGVNGLSKQGFVAGIHQHSAVGADDEILHGAVDIPEYGHLVDIFAALRLRIVIHQVIDLGIGVDMQERAAAGGVLGDHVALEVDGAVEIRPVIDRRVLREVGCDEDMAVGVFHLRVIQLPVGGHGDVGGVRPEGDLIQRHPAALIGGRQRGPPAVVGGQVRQLHLFVQREAAVLIFRQLQGQGLGVLVLWQLHAVRALDGQRHAGVLTLAAQIAAQVGHLHMELDRGAVRSGRQALHRHRAGQGAAAHQVDGLKDIVVLIAAEALGVVIGGGHELQGVPAALDQAVKAQVFARRVRVRGRRDLLGRQDRVAVVEVDRDGAVVEDGAVRVEDLQTQELRHIRCQEQIAVLDHGQRLFGHKAVVGHAHRNKVLLPALANHGFNAEGIFGKVRQTVLRHGDAQLHGVGIAGDLLRIGIGGGVDQEAVPRVGPVFILCAVQHHVGGDMVARQQLHGLADLVVAVISAVGQCSCRQNGPVDLFSALFLQNKAEFVHQRQQVLGGVGGHGGHHGGGGIQQRLGIDAGAEGDPAAAQRRRIDRQRAQLRVVQAGQHPGGVLRVRLGGVVAAYLCGIETGEGQAGQFQFIELTVGGIFQLQLLHALAAGGDIRRVPRAVQIRSGAALSAPQGQTQGSVLPQGAVRIADLDGQRQGVHHVFFFRDDHRGGRFMRIDRLPLTGGDQRDLVAEAVLHRNLGTGVLPVGAQRGAGGGKGGAPLVLGAVQHRGADAHSDRFTAIRRPKGQLHASDIGQGVQLEVLKAVVRLRLIAGGIGHGQTAEGKRLGVGGKADCPIGGDGLHIPLLHGGEGDLNQVGGIDSAGDIRLAGGRVLFLRIVAEFVLEVHLLPGLQGEQGKFLAAAGLALAQHGALPLIAAAGIDRVSLCVFGGGSAALDVLEHREADAAHDGAAGVVHVYLQAQGIAPGLYILNGDLRLLIGDLGAGAVPLADLIALAVAGVGAAAAGAAAAGAAAASAGTAAAASASAGTVASAAGGAACTAAAAAGASGRAAAGGRVVLAASGGIARTFLLAVR